MSYRSSTCISIGGPIAEVDIEGLAETAFYDGAGFDWDSSFDDREDAIQYIRSILDGGGALNFYASENRGGSFDTIESFCRDAELTYFRHDEGDGECDGTGVYWDPEQPGVWEFSVNKDGEPVVPLSCLEDMERKGMSLRDVIDDMKVPSIPPLTQATGHRNMERAAARGKENGGAA